MKLYERQHQFYCGIDLHSKTLHACLIDPSGEKKLHRNYQCARAEHFFKSIERLDTKDLVIGCESTFNWYWFADECEKRQLTFILGHAFYLKAIHHGKVKSDPIDSEKIAKVIRGGNFQLSHVYSKQGRAARDLMRRRTHFVRRRAEALAHIQIVHLQHNLPQPTNIRYKANRAAVGDGLVDPFDLLNVDADLKVIEALDEQIRRLENFLIKTAKVDDPQSYHRLKTIPGVGDVLAMTIMYEIGQLGRFAKIGDFLSYCRLVAGSHSSAGKSYGSPGRKIGNPHLRQAFAEMVSLFKRESSAASDWCARMEKKHGKGQAMTMLACKLGRAVFYMLRRKTAFDQRLMFR